MFPCFFLFGGESKDSLFCNKSILQLHRHLMIGTFVHLCIADKSQPSALGAVHHYLSTSDRSLFVRGKMTNFGFHCKTNLHIFVQICKAQAQLLGQGITQFPMALCREFGTTVFDKMKHCKNCECCHHHSIQRSQCNCSYCCSQLSAI